MMQLGNTATRACASLSYARDNQAKVQRKPDHTNRAVVRLTK